MSRQTTTHHFASSYRFAALYQSVREQGYILYPGKLTQVETFRVGCIGAIDATVLRNAVAAIEHSLREMGITLDSPVTNED